MSVVRGDNVIIYILDNGVWKLYACARSCTLDVATEILETTVSGHGDWKSYVATVNSFSGSFDGVVNLDMPDMLSLPQLRALQVARIPLMFRMQRTDEDGNVYTDEGTIILTRSSDTGTYNDVNTFAIDFTGTGALTQLFTVTPGTINSNDMRYEFTATSSGQTEFTFSGLTNKYLLSVVKDGVECSRILTAGTPVNKEVKYTASTGTFEFAQTWEPGEEGVIVYREI